MDQLCSTPTPETTNVDPPQDTIHTSQRTKKPPAYLADYHCNQATTSITHSLHSQVVHPISKSLSYVALSPSHKSYSLAIFAETEPSSYEEATKYACWREAMKAEIVALEENQTWTVVDLPNGVVPIGNKWVFKIKRKSNGSIERYKARLVAKGYNQIEGLDYFDTFSLLPR